MTNFNLTAAVIGTGYIGLQHLEALLNIVTDVVVCNADVVSGKAVADKYGLRFYSDYTEMFDAEKLDFVCICVPTHIHGKIARAALDRGINVLCEKPFTSSLQEAYEITESADAGNLTLMVAHCVRFSKEYEYLKRCIDGESFGHLISLELHRNGPKPNWSTNNWLFDMEKSGGVLRDAHIHDTDVLNFLLGMPQSVYSKGSAFCCSTLYGYGTDVLVSASASWRNASSYPFCPGYEAAFEKAVLKFDGNSLLLYSDEGVATNPHKSENFPDYMESDNLIANEITYFCKCLDKGIKPERCAPEHVCKSLEINFAEAESMKSGEIIKLSR